MRYKSKIKSLFHVKDMDWQIALQHESCGNSFGRPTADSVLYKGLYDLYFIWQANMAWLPLGSITL